MSTSQDVDTGRAPADPNREIALAAERTEIERAKLRATGAVEVRAAKRTAEIIAKRTTRETVRTHRTADAAVRARRVTRAASIIAPLVGVNGLAIAGQMIFFHGVGVDWWLAACVAAVIESVALFLNYHAHVAALANDAAGRLRTFAYLAGIGVGALNASHWLHKPNGIVFAVIFGAASALSPLLWGIHSRRVNRDRLADLGLIDVRTARFGASRWLWFPVRTMYAHRWAVFNSEMDPARAIALSGIQGPAPRNEVQAARVERKAVREADRKGESNRAPEGVDAREVAETAGESPATDATEAEADAPISDETNANGALDAAVLMAATPPPWEGVSKREAVARADELLPGRTARILAVALREVGIEVTEASVRSIRSARRRKAANKVAQ
jgi:Protein of unknown function (DUF2637)